MTGKHATGQADTRTNSMAKHPCCRLAGPVILVAASPREVLPGRRISCMSRDAFTVFSRHAQAGEELDRRTPPARHHAKPAGATRSATGEVRPLPQQPPRPAQQDPQPHQQARQPDPPREGTAPAREAISAQRPTTHSGRITMQGWGPWVPTDRIKTPHQASVGTHGPHPSNRKKNEGSRPHNRRTTRQHDRPPADPAQVRGAKASPPRNGRS